MQSIRSGGISSGTSNKNPSSGGSSTSTTTMPSQTPLVIKQINQNRSIIPDDEISQMFQRSQSSRMKATNGFPISSTNSSVVDIKPAASHQAPGRNLVKNLVNNIYENNCANSASSPVLAARSSFRLTSNRSQDSSNNSPNSARSFQAFKNSELQNHVYDNSGAKNYSPSLDRKSVTRASLPINYRSGSAMSSGSSNASVSARLDNSYGVINSLKNTSSSSNTGDNHKPTLSTCHEQQIGSITWIEILEPKSKTKMFANLSR